jgi:hypothetical protein
MHHVVNNVIMAPVALVIMHPVIMIIAWALALYKYVYLPFFIYICL